MKVVSRILILLLALVLVVAGVFTGVYFTRIQTVSSIRKVTSYDDYNLYSMNVQYDYSLDDVINAGITDTQSLIDAIVGEVLPLLPVKVRVPSFGCSAFTAQTADGEIMAMRHKEYPVVGLQFHPESIYTEHGKRMIENFLSGVI